MEYISYVKIFNQTVDDFFQELIDIFPEETKIRVQYSLFQTLISANAKQPCIKFMNGSVKYLEKIAMRDETFFKSDDKPGIFKSINIENLWTDDLSINTKNAIWNYIQSFFTIGIKVIEMPSETHSIIQYIIDYRN